MANVEKMKSAGKIQWHPGFYGAAELELIDDLDHLEFCREVPLREMPLRLDLLIVRKSADVKIKNEIGYIFLRNNIVEYMGPDDKMDINVFMKAQGYACFYAGEGTVPVNEITVTLVSYEYPRELIKSLEQLGYTVNETDGIISVTSDKVFFLHRLLYPVG